MLLAYKFIYFCKFLLSIYILLYRFYSDGFLFFIKSQKIKSQKLMTQIVAYYFPNEFFQLVLLKIIPY